MKELKKKGDHFVLRGDSGQAWGAVSNVYSVSKSTELKLESPRYPK